MNFLAHLFLAEPTDESRIGGILADFTVGRIETLEARYGPGIARGIQLHRDIDRFTDSHPAVRSSVACLQPAQGMFAGIVVDVVYDYYLLKHWHQFTDEPPDVFLERAYASLRRMEWDFPPTYQAVVGRMLEGHWLPSYGTLEGVHYALFRMSERLKSRFPKGTNLHRAIECIHRCYKVLDRDFLIFFPEVIALTQEFSYKK